MQNRVISLIYTSKNIKKKKIIFLTNIQTMYFPTNLISG